MLKYLLISIILFLSGCVEEGTNFQIKNIYKAKMEAVCKEHGGAYSFLGRRDDDLVTCKDGYKSQWRDYQGPDVLIELNKIEDEERQKTLNKKIPTSEMK